MRKEDIIKNIEDVNFNKSEIDICSNGYARIMLFIYGKFEEFNIFEDDIQGKTYDVFIKEFQRFSCYEVIEWAMDIPVFQWWVHSLLDGGLVEKD